MATSPSPTLVARNSRIAISAVFLVFGALVGSWFPHLQDIKKQVGLDDAALGKALLCSGTGAVVMMSVVGSLVHRFGSRIIAVVGGVCACCLVPLIALETGFWGLCANLLILGLAYGCLDIGMNAQSIEIQALHKKAIISSIHGWFSAGGIFGGLGAALASKVGLAPFHHLLIVSGTLISILLASYSMLLPASAETQTDGPKFVLPKGILLVFGIFCVCAFVIEGGIIDWCSVYVRQSLQASAEFGGIATATCSGSMAVGRFVGDQLLRAFGNKRVVLVSGIISTVGTVAAVSTHSLLVTIIFFGITCFGLANMVPVFFKEAGSVPNVPPSTALAAVTTCGYGGLLLGPPVIGAVAKNISLGFSLGCLSVLGLIVTVASPFVLHDSTGDDDSAPGTVPIPEVV